MENGIRWLLLVSGLERSLYCLVSGLEQTLHCLVKGSSVWFGTDPLRLINGSSVWFGTFPLLSG